jgi:hypothetical protein
MLIKLIRPTIVTGHPGAQVGQPIEVEDSDAVSLINHGRAVAIPHEAQQIEVREPEVENRDPQPVTIRHQAKRIKSKLV